MNKKGLLTLLCAAALVSVAGCNKSSGKKKKTDESPTSSSQPDGDEAKMWKNGFAGCVAIGGSKSATADTEDALDPASDTSMMFVVFEDQKEFGIAGKPDRYNITINYDFSMDNGDANNYIEAKVKTADKTVVFFKNWPAAGTDAANYPRIKVKATGTINGVSQERNYKLVLSPFTRQYATLELSDVYAKHASKPCLKWMDENFVPFKQDAPVANAYGPSVDYDPAWQATWDAEKKSFIANVESYGRVTYVSPDGNNGILQAGDHCIQLYQLVNYKGWAATGSTLMNQDVIVRGTLSGGYGNIQFSYIDEIIPLPSGYGKTVVPPTAAAQFTEAMISNTSWADNPIFNKVVAPTSVTYQGNVHVIHNKSGGDATVVDDEITGSALQSVDFNSKRYEFDVKIGSTKFKVQTDYHIIKDEAHPELANNLKTLVNKPVGSSVQLGGTIRWLNDRSKVGGNDYSTRIEGEWELVPFLAEHVVA